jgi:hypothetical protein
MVDYVFTKKRIRQNKTDNLMKKLSYVKPGRTFSRDELNER